MSGFVIYALGLTFAYAVYFSIVITLDLHGKKKEEEGTGEETFDVRGMDNEEKPVSVEEHAGGREGDDMTYTEQVTDDGLRVVTPTGGNLPDSSPLTEEEPRSARRDPTTSTELNRESEEDMEEIEPAYQNALLPDEFMQSLNDRHNKRKIEKRNAIDNV